MYNKQPGDVASLIIYYISYYILAHIIQSTDILREAGMLSLALITNACHHILYCIYNTPRGAYTYAIQATYMTRTIATSYYLPRTSLTWRGFATATCMHANNVNNKQY